MKPTPAAKAAKSTAFPPEIIEVEEALVQDSTWWYFVDDHDHDDEFFDGLGEVYIDDGVDVDDDNMIDYHFEINAMDVLMQNSTWWSYNGHICITLSSTKTISHLLSLIDGWKISLSPQMGLFFRNTFLRCLTYALCLIWCIGLAGGSQFAIIYFEIWIASIFSKFLHFVALSHNWPDNTLLVLSEQCFWFRPILSLMIWR